MHEYFKYVQTVMTYDEFVIRFLMVFFGLVFLSVITYISLLFAFINSRQNAVDKLSKQERKKFKAICKAEGLKEQLVIKDAMQKYIEDYEYKTHINFDEYI